MFSSLLFIFRKNLMIIISINRSRSSKKSLYGMYKYFFMSLVDLIFARIFDLN